LTPSGRSDPGDTLEIQLNPSNALDEVVITALGLKRSEKALGYSVQGIKGSEVAKVKAVNIVSSLSGKVSGVNITNGAGRASSLFEHYYSWCHLFNG
jgi:outer membrane cobalamin receptor